MRLRAPDGAVELFQVHLPGVSRRHSPPNRCPEERKDQRALGVVEEGARVRAAHHTASCRWPWPGGSLTMIPPQNPEDDARKVAMPESADMPAPVNTTYTTSTGPRHDMSRPPALSYDRPVGE